MDEFQSELNSDFLIGQEFPQLSFFRSIREPHTLKSDHDPSYQVINTISMVAILFLSLFFLALACDRCTLRRNFGLQRDPQNTENQSDNQNLIYSGTRPLKVCSQGLFLSYLENLHQYRSCPVSTDCPWVSKDGLSPKGQWVNN